MEGIAKQAEAFARQRLPAGMMTRLTALMYQVTECASWKDVLELADAIIQMIQDEHEKEQKRAEQAAQQDAGQPPSDVSGQQDSLSSQAGGSGRQDVENGQEPGPAEQGGCAGDDEGEASQPAESTGGLGTGSADQALERLLDTTDEDVPEDLGEMLRKALNGAAANDTWDGESIAMPNVHPARLPIRSVDMSGLRGSVNATRTRTLQWMSSVAEGEVSYSHAGMRIDSSRIWQGRFNGAIFCREMEGIDLNAAVSILIDRSGSMRDIIGGDDARLRCAWTEVPGCGIPLV